MPPYRVSPETRIVLTLAKAQGSMLLWPPSKVHLAEAILHTAHALQQLSNLDDGFAAHDLVIEILDKIKGEREVTEPPSTA